MSFSLREKLKNIICKHVLNNCNIKKHFNFSYKTQKHNISKIISVILTILKTGMTYKDAEDIYNISHSTIYNTFKRLQKFNVFESTYIQLLQKYITKSPNKKLKYRLTDTTNIYNKKCKIHTAYNKKAGNKKILKVSMITDVNGIPYNIKIYDGNRYDSVILSRHLTHRNPLDIYDDNKYKKYFLADAGYDSENIRTLLIQMNFEPIIWYNKRNIKDKSKIKRFTDKEKLVYKKRVNIEYIFGRIKNGFKRLNYVYEITAISYLNYLYLSVCFQIMKYI